MMKAPRGRPEVHQRFLTIVQRALARADREVAEELARLRPGGRQTATKRHRLHDAIVDPWPRGRRVHRARSGAPATSRSDFMVSPVTLKETP
jgi:hypothetical protein